MTKLILLLLKDLRPESGARMRARLKREAFLRGLFYQGEHPPLQYQSRELDLCHSTMETRSNTTLAELLVLLRVEVITPILSLLNWSPLKLAKRLVKWRST